MFRVYTWEPGKKDTDPFYWRQNCRCGKWGLRRALRRVRQWYDDCSILVEAESVDAIKQEPGDE